MNVHHALAAQHRIGSAAKTPSTSRRLDVHFDDRAISVTLHVSRVNCHIWRQAVAGTFHAVEITLKIIQRGDLVLELHENVRATLIGAGAWLEGRVVMRRL